MIEEQNEDFDQKRFITAMVISGLVLIIWQTFFAPEPPPPNPDQGQTNSEKVVEKPTEKKEETPTAKLDDEPAEKVDVKTFDAVEHVLQLDGAKVSFSNTDAAATHALINDPEQYIAAGDLFDGLPKDAKARPFGLRFADDEIPIQTNVNWEVVDTDKVRDNTKAITYRYMDPKGRFIVEKEFARGSGRYVMDVTVRVENRLSDAKLAGKPLIDLVGYQDPDREKSWLDFRPDDWEGLCKTEEDMERALDAELQEESVKAEGRTIWAGVNKLYTLVAAIADEDGLSGCTLDLVDGSLVRSILPFKEIQAGPGEKTEFSFKAYVGPKDYDVLTDTGHKLEESVDYGLLTFICRPMRWALIQCYKVTGNWGWAILLLTVLIRGLLWPINAKIYKNSERMKEIQPLMQEIREKYKDDQQRLQEETMKVMKENNVSMLGCAPMFLQMPVFLAVYWTILYSSEVYQADWAFWYTDLSAPDPFYVLPVLMGVLMFAQFSMAPTGDTPQAKQMKTMMRIMPIMMAAFMVFLPSGVNLYYVLSLVIGLIQQKSMKLKPGATSIM